MTGPVNFSNGLNGIRVGLDGMQKTASQIASKDAMESNGPHELAESMVDLKIHRNQVGASAQVVKAFDQMLGTLLDIKA
jgi:flagellar hook protein FlgE